MKKIPCLVCSGPLFQISKFRLRCKKCKQEYRLAKVEKTKRKLKKKCVICGLYFENSLNSVRTCSKRHSILHRKNWFRRYNKEHKEEIRKSRLKYEKTRKRNYKKEYIRRKEIRGIK